MDTYYPVVPNNQQRRYTDTAYNYNKASSSSMTLRPRYPTVQQQYPQHIPSFAPSSASAFASYHNLNTSGSNSGRSNCFSPTYAGLTDVFVTRTSGSTVLYVDPKRRGSNFLTRNLKRTFLVCSAIAIVCLLAFTLFGCVSSYYTGIKSKEPTVFSFNSPRIPVARHQPKLEPVLNEESNVKKHSNIKSEKFVSETEKQETVGRPATGSKTKSKAGGVRFEYSVDADDDEVLIEDVIL